MFDHVTIGVSDLAASRRFYATVLAALGAAPPTGGDELPEWDDFGLAQAGDGRGVTRGLHLGFAAASREAVDAFWRAGVEAGFQDDGAPGPRPQYREDYYGAFLLDPDGNSAEAVHHGRTAPRGIDHLWIRVADVDASARFYEAIAPHAGFALRHHGPERATFGNERGSFSVVPGRPTENVHVAFPAPAPGAVEAFHAAALAAGYADNGAPGERPAYHPGYRAAFVLDPDGHNVEVVDHGDRP